VILFKEIASILAVALLIIGLFSCTKDDDDPNGFQWDDSLQGEEYRPINAGKKSSYFKIDDKIISFAVPYLVGTLVVEYPPEPDDLGLGGYTPHFCRIHLIMPKGIDVTKLAPVVTLAHGATIKRIEWAISNKIPPKQDDYVAIDVDYTGITEVGVINFRYTMEFTILAPNGSIVRYVFDVVAIGDVLPWMDCP